MNFNEHSEIVGKHAILGASQYGWLSYDTNQLRAKLKRKLAPMIGTILHQMAADEFIGPGVRIRKKDKSFVRQYLLDNGVPKFACDVNIYFDNVYRYINDSVDYGMTPEVPLVYSEYFFGTADAMQYENNELYIFDLKTGFGRVSLKQLYIYAALFCLEYDVDPRDINTYLRIYQTDSLIEEDADGKDIRSIMNKMKSFNRRISKMGGT